MQDWSLPIIDQQRCTRCGRCVTECPTQAVEMCKHGPVIARPTECTFCTTCEAICPVNAIRCEFEIVWSN